jgi:threonine dehydrogenase-like Zn-dependent dehydrogenase
MAQKCAWVRGAKRVIGLDIEPYRRDGGAQCQLRGDQCQEGDAVEAIRSMTEGRGADVCIDAVGMEAEQSLLDKAKNVLHMRSRHDQRPNDVPARAEGGAVSILGVCGMPYDNFPIGQIFDKGLTIYSGQALVHRYIDELISWLENDQIRLSDIITHRLPLAEAPHGYEIFNEKKDGCVKVVLSP